MKFPAVILVLLCAAPLFAHPLEDRAEMTSEVVVVSDSRLELVMDFRYENVMASWSEFSGGSGHGNDSLDRNMDGLITRTELKVRFAELAGKTFQFVAIKLDGQALGMKPDFERFQFDNLDDPDAKFDLEAGVPIDTFRIHYRFLFYWDAPQPLAGGDHTVEYSFTGAQGAVRDPTQQIIAYDARVQPRRRIEGSTYDQGALPRLTFTWHVKGEPPVEATDQPPSNMFTEPEPSERPDGEPGPIEDDDVRSTVAASLTFVVGCIVAVLGLASFLFTLRKGAPDGKSLGKALVGRALMLLAGTLIAFGAMVRLGVIRLLH